ncbi:serine/threonine-protein kinase [Erythrobacter sp. GH1-10]|uniref:serine/threonine-protein kinase n=1 Tax=Erythrobacter sp. GH1-10 TaxID=3349334 RepID=UPI0038779E85
MAAGASGSSSRLEPGTILNNNYRILKPLGEGGMGAVYLASNTFIDEDKVAIKVIRSEQARDELIQKMFAKEVRALLRINNPRIVGYRTFANDPELGIDFIVTEFIDGESLAAVMGNRQFSTDDLVRLLIEICIGLRAAHKAGVIHRDLAPDNILLESGDITRPKIIDFGIVKDTVQGGTIVGTGFAGKPNFVAPEQLGEPEYPIGAWTDIYSLALVILGLAKGQQLEMGHTPGAAIRKRHEPIDLTPVAPELRLLIADMLALHPEERIQSVEEVMIRAEAVLRGEEPPAPADPALEKTIVAPTATISTVYDPGSSLGDLDTNEAAEAATSPAMEEDELPMDDPTTEMVNGEDDYDDEEEPEPDEIGVWIFLGFLVLVALAVFAGSYFGDVAPFAD